MNSIGKDERVARVLKPSWLYKGEIAAAAFNLRPTLKETYVSVLREHIPTFEQDAKTVCKEKKNILYASIKVDELEERKETVAEQTVTFQIKETDNDTLKSHAGIFIAVNGHNIVGGEPFESYIKESFVSENDIILEISKRLAKVGGKDIRSL